MGNSCAGFDKMVVLHNKLAMVAKYLGPWSAQSVENIREQLLLANEIILVLDKVQKEEVSPPPSLPAERWLGVDLKRKCLGFASLQHTIAHQKSRVTHLSEGDANTAFFHAPSA